VASTKLDRDQIVEAVQAAAGSGAEGAAEVAELITGRSVDAAEAVLHAASALGETVAETVTSAVGTAKIGRRGHKTVGTHHRRARLRKRMVGVLTAAGTATVVVVVLRSRRHAASLDAPVPQLPNPIQPPATPPPAMQAAEPPTVQIADRAEAPAPESASGSAPTTAAATNTGNHRTAAGPRKPARKASGKAPRD
jgi:hypothetical protein